MNKNEKKTQPERKCICCNKRLVRIGTERKNGVGNEWASRNLHRQCYTRIKAFYDLCHKCFQEIDDINEKRRIKALVLNHIEKYGSGLGIETTLAMLMKVANLDSDSESGSDSDSD
jgi:hypothetical protein